MADRSSGVVTARNGLARRLTEAYVSLKGWSAVGGKFGISGGMAYRIAKHGYWPKDKDINKALASKMLPAEYAAAADWLANRQRRPRSAYCKPKGNR